MKILNERQQKILERLETKKYISVNELGESLNVSLVTIRKDLTILEEAGYLYRTHGGASKQARYAFEQDVFEKESIHVEEKMKIATKAMEFIHESDFIIISSGTTMHFLARMLNHYEDLTILTPSMRVALELCKQKNINIVHLGGEVRKSSTSTIGVLAEETLRNFSCNTLFLSVEGIDLEQGISTTNAGEAHLNKMMMNRADKTIVLADASKMHKIGFGIISDIEKIDMLITDSKADRSFLEALESKGVEVVIVS
ncbi:DeoR/GlpR family DNA-binding transcription regulator [Capnocytophaga canimorsus]|uniref:DeoR/GlpR family DNA-binding transcription regulator n=1 Tax=Capnocytophaga canimorsus TaxID=28188 RepID=UPI0037CE91A4